MHINAHLDIDLVAIETTDSVTLMLELEAPAADDASCTVTRCPFRAAETASRW